MGLARSALTTSFVGNWGGYQLLLIRYAVAQGPVVCVGGVLPAATEAHPFVPRTDWAIATPLWGTEAD